MGICGSKCNLLAKFSYKSPVPNFAKIRIVRTEYRRTDERTYDFQRLPSSKNTMYTDPSCVSSPEIYAILVKFCIWGYGLTVGVLEFDSRRGLGIFLFITASRTALGLTQGVKQPGCEADHSTPFSAEIKE